MSDLDQVETDAKKQPSRLGWWALMALAIGYVWLVVGPNIGGPQHLPSFQVEGWTNLNTVSNETSEPTLENLKGKYVVVDAWATWCAPCRRKMPDLARLYSDWQSKGVVFLGITPEPSSDMATIDGFAASVDGFDWPVAYGGKRTLNDLNVQLFPTLMFFDPTGKELWRGHRTKELEVELARHIQDAS